MTAPEVGLNKPGFAYIHVPQQKVRIEDLVKKPLKSKKNISGNLGEITQSKSTKEARPSAAAFGISTTEDSGRAPELGVNRPGAPFQMKQQPVSVKELKEMLQPKGLKFKTPLEA